ncbi:SLH, S-layer homology domain W [Streptococcus dysgalactiae subsp. equisimilis]|nr:hypothetical protein SDSE167_0581 [Streptococcus dysgalactiae subsp. equisimilis 167]SQE85376.1 SLH, S-layer homology domain W [Streptococcus dysgalactiae subsp. equisimilis]
MLAALLVSSLSALNYEVKADDTTDGYHYYVTQQDRYGQIVNYINEQHRLLNQYVVENVNAFDQLNAKSAVDRLNSAIASFKQTDDQLLAQLKVGRISNSEMLLAKLFNVWLTKKIVNFRLAKTNTLN